MTAKLSEAETAELLRCFRRAVDARIARELAEEDATGRALKDRVLPVVRTALAQARAQGMCREAWLFCSNAWGTPSERSDIDLLVTGAAEPLLVAAVISRATGRDLHAIALERAPESLRQRVLAEGVPL